MIKENSAFENRRHRPSLAFRRFARKASRSSAPCTFGAHLPVLVFSNRDERRRFEGSHTCNIAVFRAMSASEFSLTIRMGRPRPSPSRWYDAGAK